MECSSVSNKWHLFDRSILLAFQCLIYALSHVELFTTNNFDRSVKSHRNFTYKRIWKVLLLLRSVQTNTLRYALWYSWQFFILLKHQTDAAFIVLRHFLLPLVRLLVELQNVRVRKTLFMPVPILMKRKLQIFTKLCINVATNSEDEHKHTLKLIRFSRFYMWNMSTLYVSFIRLISIGYRHVICWSRRVFDKIIKVSFICRIALSTIYYLEKSFRGEQLIYSQAHTQIPSSLTTYKCLAINKFESFNRKPHAEYHEWQGQNSTRTTKFRK